MMPVSRVEGGGLSRSFVFALVLVMLFLTLQADWNVAQNRKLKAEEAKRAIIGGTGRSAGGGAEGKGKDRLIVELSDTLEALQGENVRLRSALMAAQVQLKECNVTVGADADKLLVETPADSYGIGMEAVMLTRTAISGGGGGAEKGDTKKGEITKVSDKSASEVVSNQGKSM